MQKTTGKKIGYILLFAILMLPVISLINVQAALSEDELTTMKDVLVDHNELFRKNDIVMSAFRQVGWGITKWLVGLAASAADLFDTCFGFIDFTTWGKVNTYINKYKVVWGAVMSLSLLATGIILMVWHEKRPKIFVNLVLAVFVFSSMTFMISKMNQFLGTDVRQEILGTNNSAGVVYETLGANIHDLVYLDRKYGLKNLDQKTGDGMVKAKATYDKLTKQQMNEIDINQILKPDLVTSDSKYLSEYELVAYPNNYVDALQGGQNSTVPDSIKVGDSVYIAQELYDGVAWTDAFNTYYFRYTVNYSTAILTLLSMIIVYFLLSFKVVKVIFENVIKEIVTLVQSANITQNQKTIKCLQALRDGYLVLLVTLVTLKVYLLATKYISTTMPNVQGYKGWIMLFIAFVVIEGPSIITQITGMDAGASDGGSKIMSAYYGMSAATSITRMAGGLTRKTASGVKHAFTKMKNGAAGNGNKESMEALKNATGKEKQAGNESMKGKPGGGEKQKMSQMQNQGEKNNLSAQSGEKSNVPPKESKDSGTGDKENKEFKDTAGEKQNKMPQIKNNADKVTRQPDEASGKKPGTASGKDKSQSADKMEKMKKDLSGNSMKNSLHNDNANKAMNASASSFNLEGSKSSEMGEMNKAVNKNKTKGKE